MSSVKRAEANGQSLFLITTASMLIGGYAIMLLALTLMYGNSRNFSPLAAGFLSSVFAFASLAARLFSGLACDRLQTKYLLLLASAGFALTPLAFLMDMPYMVLVAIRIFQGVCMSLATTAAGAIATVVIPRDHFTEGIGYYGIGMAVSSAVAPGIGLWLLDRFGYSGVFLFSAAVGVSTLLLALLIHCPNSQKASHPQVVSFGELYERSALFSTLCTLVLSIAQVTIMQFLGYYIAERGSSGTGSFYAVSAIAVLTVRFLGGKLRTLASDKGLLLAGTTILLSAYAGLFFSYPATTTLCILAIAYGIGHSMTGMVLNAMAVSNAPKDRIGAANATYLAASDLGYAVGPILWNAYCGRMDYRHMYLISALAITALLLIFVIRILKIERNN